MEKDMNIDCWDFKNCPQDRKEACVAFKQNRGKECWIANGTLCGGVKRDNPDEKMRDCLACDFYKMRDGTRG